MQIHIEPNNGIPIYEQLVRQMKYAVAEGILLPGQLVPSVREMAKRLAVNPNTVQRAYLQLQEETVLQSLRGRGMTVATDAKQRCISDRQAVIAARLRAVVSEAVQSGLESEQLKEMFLSFLESTTECRGSEIQRQLHDNSADPINTSSVSSSQESPS